MEITLTQIRERLHKIHIEYCDKYKDDDRCYCDIETLIIDVFDTDYAEYKKNKKVMSIGENMVNFAKVIENYRNKQ